MWWLFLLIFFSITQLIFAQEPEVFLVKPLENGLQYLEKINPRFNLKEKDHFKIKIFVEPRKTKARVLLANKPLRWEEGSLKSRGEIIYRKDGFSLNIIEQGEGEIYWSYPLKNPLDIWDFPYFRLRFKGEGPEPAIQAFFYFDTNGDGEKDLVLKGTYPQSAQMLTLTMVENVSQAKFKPKSYGYLVRRELGFKTDRAWRYTQDGSSTVLQKVFNIPINKAEFIRFYFKPGTYFERVNLFIDTDGNGRKDRLVLWEQLVHYKRQDVDSIVEIDIDASLKKLNIDPQKAKIYEIIVFLKGDKETILKEKILRKLEFFKKGDEKSWEGVPLKINRAGDRKELIFEIQKKLQEDQIFSAKLLKLDLKISFKKENFGHFIIGNLAFLDFSIMEVPSFLFKPYRALEDFLNLPLFPGEYVKSFDLLWWENSCFVFSKTSFVKKRVNSNLFQKLIEKQINKVVNNNLFLKAIYNKDLFLYANIYYEEKSGKENYISRVIPNNRFIEIPFLKGKKLKKIEIWANLKTHLQKEPLEKYFGKIEEILLIDAEIDELEYGRENNEIFWYVKREDINLTRSLKKTYLLDRSLRLSISLPKISSFFSFLKLKYHFSDEVSGRILTYIQNTKENVMLPLFKKGEVYIPFSNHNYRFPPSKIIFDFYLNDHKTIPYVIFIDDIKLIAFGIPYSLTELIYKELPFLVSIDGNSLPLTIEVKDKEIVSLGKWLEAGEIDLDIGEHSIDINKNSFLIPKAIVLEAQNEYPLPMKLKESANISQFENRLKKLFISVIKVFLVIVIFWILFRYWKVKKIIINVKTLFLKIYGVLPDIFWMFFWLTMAIIFYFTGFKYRVSQGENYWWTFGGIWIVIAYHHFIKLIKNTFQKAFPKLGNYVYRGSGTPYVSGFIFILLICAILLVLNLEPLANQLAIIGYYLLVIGVVRELIDFSREQENKEVRN